MCSPMNAGLRAVRPNTSLERARRSAQSVGAMGVRCLAVICLVSVGVFGCATHPTPTSRQMQTCVDGATPADVTAESFAAALREAQRYSDEKYGSDCFVCAELLDDSDEYMLHITSPIEDTLINTSAAITVRKRDGAVTERAIWHSCHARIKKASHVAPNTSLEWTRERLKRQAHTSARAALSPTVGPRHDVNTSR